MVDGAEGHVSCTLPNGNGLLWYAIRAREKHGETRVHGYEVVVVIIRVYLDNELAFLDSHKRDQGIVASSQGSGQHRKGAW